MVCSNLERYQIYQDSELSWLEEVPAVWKLNRHKDNFISITNRCTNPLLTKVGLENIESKTGRFIMSDSEFEGDGVHFKINDILFGKLRPYLAKVYLAEFEGNAIGDIFVYRPKKSISSRFASYLMLSDRYIDVINSSTAGAKMPRVSSSFIANLAIALPSKHEQEEIVNYLDDKAARIDHKINLLTQKVEHYEKLKQSLINEIVTHGLDKTVAMKNSGIEWLGEVPNHWDIQRGKDVFKQSKRKVGLNSADYDVLSLTLKGVIKRDLDNMKGKIPESFDGYQIARPDNLVLCLFDMDVTPRIIGYVNQLGIITSAYTILKSSKYVYMKYYFYYYLDQNRNQSLLANSKTLRSTMTYDLFSHLPLPLPPLSEQKAIADHLDEKTAKIDQIVITANTQIEKLKELRKTLINDVVTGKIKVAEEDGKGLAA